VLSGLVFAAGTRFEKEKEHGIAHFAEHAVFKGSKLYPGPQEITEKAEALGCAVEGMTDASGVIFPILSRAEAAQEALNLFTDMTLNPLLPEKELVIERKVVVEEVRRAEDNPEARAFFLLQRAMHGLHPLGRNTLGSVESVLSFGEKDVRQFIDRQWAAPQAWLVLIGNPPAIKGLDTEAFSGFIKNKPAPPALAAPEFEGQQLVETSETEQSYLNLGFKTKSPLQDERQRAAFGFLLAVLSHGGSSRLHHQFRENRGWCYRVGAYPYLDQDHTNLIVSIGVKNEHCVEAYHLIREMIAELPETLQVEEVEKVRVLLLTELAIGFHDLDWRFIEISYSLTRFGKAPGDKEKLLKEISFEEVIEVARLIEPESALSCVGPHRVDDFV
jgi:predicted Zn-dependent peptidase